MGENGERFYDVTRQTFLNMPELPYRDYEGTLITSNLLEAADRVLAELSTREKLLILADLMEAGVVTDFSRDLLNPDPVPMGELVSEILGLTIAGLLEKEEEIRLRQDSNLNF